MKKLMIGLVVVIVLLGVLLWLAYSNLDKIVARLIEQTGSEVTQTAVEVGGVELDLLNGKAALAQLTVANPAGFSSPTIFTLERIAVAIDVETLGASPVVIDEVVVRQPGVDFEMDQAGRSNVDVLRKNVAEYSAARETPAGSEPAAGEGAAQGEQMRLRIRQLRFEGGRLSAVSALRPGQPVEVTLPAFTMNDIGGGNGATPDAIAREVLDRLARQAADAAKKAGVDKVKAELEKKGREKLQEKMGGALDGLLGK